MKYAADFREIARNALRGRWPVAVLTGFVASLIGAGIASAGGGSSSNSSNRVSRGELNDFFQSALWHQIKPVVITLLVLVFIWSIIQIIIGGAGKLGYAKFNLNLVDNKDAVFSDLFSQFDRLGAGFCMNFLTGLYIVLWTLLFIIPGIIKSFSYAMAPYILAEHPEMTASEAITESRHMMDGNKWRLFCLDFSFIGWNLLCSLPVIVAVFALSGSILRSSAGAYTLLWLIPLSIPLSAGFLFLRPYEEAAWAAFYRDVSGTDVQQPLCLTENYSESASDEGTTSEWE